MTVSPLDRQLARWPFVSLSELTQRAALLDRDEKKYVVAQDRIGELLELLRPDFDVLAIGDRRLFTYETTYYDTVDLLTFRQHVQDKRRRFKIRSRRYVDSGDCFFEVKLKGRRGRTIKERIPYQDPSQHTVSQTAATFVEHCVGRHYGVAFDSTLLAALVMRYQRLTLVGRHQPERVTVDLKLAFGPPERSVAPIAPGRCAIIEVKAPGRHSLASDALRRAGERSSRCSKYCVGLNLIRDDVRHNPFKTVLTNHFGWTSPTLHDPVSRAGARSNSDRVRS